MPNKPRHHTPREEETERERERDREKKSIKTPNTSVEVPEEVSREGDGILGFNEALKMPLNT